MQLRIVNANLKISSNFNARCNYRNEKNYPYQIILQHNLQRLANFIVDKKREHSFIIPKMKSNRTNNLEFRDKIFEGKRNWVGHNDENNL